MKYIRCKSFFFLRFENKLYVSTVWVLMWYNLTTYVFLLLLLFLC